MNNPDDHIAVDFIDPLFAVVLGVSFSQIYIEPWFMKPAMFQEPYRFSVCTLLVAYLTVILSWIGYHISIKRSPISIRDMAGQYRFALDVILLFAYLVLLVSYKDFLKELITLVAIFAIFVVWDYCKYREYAAATQDASTKKESASRRGVTVLYTIVFAVVVLIYQIDWPVIPHLPVIPLSWKRWIALILVFIATFLYREHKNRLWMGTLLQRLEVLGCVASRVLLSIVSLGRAVP